MNTTSHSLQIESNREFFESKTQYRIFCLWYKCILSKCSLNIEHCSAMCRVNSKYFTRQKFDNCKTFWINSSLCTVPFMPFLKCPSAMPFLKCPSAMPFLNCPSRIRFLKMPFLNYFPPKDALPQNSFPKKCPSLTCPPTIPHQRQCKHCNN